MSNVLLPVDYHLYPDFNPQNKKYRDQSIKKYLVNAKQAMISYPDKIKSEDVARRRLKYFGYNRVQFIRKPYKLGKSRGFADAYCAWNKDVFSFAIAGTDDKGDVKIDVDIRPHKKLGLVLHNGVSKYFDMIWPDIKKIYKKHGTKKKVVGSGHSLGGGATVAGVIHFERELNVSVHCAMTMGQLRIVHEDSEEEAEGLIGHLLHRCVFANDAVARMPYRVMNYRHVGRLHNIKTTGRFSNKAKWANNLWGRVSGLLYLDVTHPFKIGVKNHDLPRNYIKKVVDKYDIDI